MLGSEEIKSISKIGSIIDTKNQPTKTSNGKASSKSIRWLWMNLGQTSNPRKWLEMLKRARS